MNPCAAVFLLASLAFAAPAADPADWAVVLDVPPGWEDVTGQRRSADILSALVGPEGSSFVLTRLKPAGMTNRAAKRALLLDVLSGINRRTGLRFIPMRDMTKDTYKNDLTAHSIHAHLNGKPRMILTIIEYRERFMLGTIKSAVPDTILPAILASIQDSSAARDRGLYRHGTSEDGQLAFSLPNGLWLRDVSPREKSESVVAVILGLDSVLSFKKIDESGTSAGEEAQIVRYMLSSVKGVDKVTPVRSAETRAGIGVLYASARTRSEGGPTELAAGFLPWGYWGYSIWATGPRAAEILSKSVAELGAGPSADKKLLSATPRIASRWSLSRKILRFGGVGAAAVAALGLAVWLVRMRRRLARRKEEGWTE